ncbi:MAG: PEGA domain-containing protein [Ignavibacteriaceae bacterium]|nr:PEGA domain-containing protein [Ignavibacteriaceae bacterium]HRI45956.1 PEGA domain-containing protein [Ignavibacteriaceae bacterium]
MMNTKLFFILMIAIAISGCSTLFNTTTEIIELRTTPENAKITINGKRYGTTPQYINLQRAENHLVKFELDGYEIYETQITQRLSYWLWANSLNGFVPGLLIDWYTGSMYNLLPDKINVELTPQKVIEPIKKK